MRALHDINQVAPLLNICIGKTFHFNERSINLVAPFLRSGCKDELS